MAVIKQAWKVNVQPLEDMAEFAGNLDDKAFQLFEQSTAEIEQGLMDDLRTYPAVPPNSTYERTYKLRDNWSASIGQAGDGLFKFEVSNDTDYAVWVVGSLAQMREAAARFQQEFHRDNGWELATDKVTRWFNRLLEDYQSRFENELAEFGGFTLKRRARTRID
jgi:hypothetical protein